MNKLLATWVALSIGLPVLFGVFMLVNAEQAIQSTGATSLLHMVVIRQVVFSGLLLVAWLKLGPAPTGWLVLGRGAMDLLDGVSMIVVGGGVKGPELFPIITAVFSFAVGVAFLRAAQPSKG